MLPRFYQTLSGWLHHPAILRNAHPARVMRDGTPITDWISHQEANRYYVPSLSHLALLGDADPITHIYMN